MYVLFYDERYIPIPTVSTTTRMLLLLLSLLLLFWWSTFISSKNTDAVFTYNHMTLCPFKAAHIFMHPWF